MFDYSSSVKAQKTTLCTREMFDNVVSSITVDSLCGRLKKLHEQKQAGRIAESYFEEEKRKLKAKLPVLLFHAHFTDAKRHNVSAQPSGLSIFDIDHIDDPAKMYETIKPHLKEWGILLAHMTPSCEGLRLVFIIPKEVYAKVDGLYNDHGNKLLAEAQRWMAGKLGLKDYDISVKDYARCSFVVPKSYIYYADYDGLFADHSIKEKPVLDHEPKVIHLKTKQVKSTDDITPGKGAQATNAPERIFMAAIKECNLKVEDLAKAGMRHTCLVSILSTGIARLMKIEDMRHAVEHFMPDFYNEPDCKQLIEDWYANYNELNKPMSRRLQRIWDAARLDDKQDSTPSLVDDSGSNPACKLNIDAMPDALRATLVSIPEELRLPTLIATIPAMGCYADKVSFNYIDGLPTRLNFMSFVVGPQASGKSACTRMVKAWARAMLEDDILNRQKKDEWKEKWRGRSQNQEFVNFPHFPILNISPNISRADLHDKLCDAQGHQLLMFTEEADMYVNQGRSGQWANGGDLMRMSDDNTEWFVDYKNAESRSQGAKVNINYSFLGTYGAFQRMFSDGNVENGLSSRFMLAEMPDNSFAPIRRYKKISDAQTKIIADACVGLRKRSGLLEVPKLSELTEKWANEKLREADMEDDRIKDTYRKRSARIMMRCGVLFSLLEGSESERVLKLTWQLGDYIFYEQCKLYGEQLQNIGAQNSMKFYSMKSASRSVFALLPNIFTIADIQKLNPNHDVSYYRVTAKRWCDRGFTSKIDISKWQKKK